MILSISIFRRHQMQDAPRFRHFCDVLWI